MGHEVRILDTRKLPSADPARVGKSDYVVTYQVDGLRTHYVLLPKEAPTEAEIQAAIKAEEKSRAGIVGRAFTID
jgi:hypothetical protein